MCKNLILKYINSKNKLDNYQSFNYILKDNNLILNSNIIKPYIEYEAFELKEIIDINLKEKMSKKQPDKWTTFNCDVCGKETERLTSHLRGKHRYCSNECSAIGSKKLKNNHI